MKTKITILVLALTIVALCVGLCACGEIENGNYTISIKPEGSDESFDYVVSVGDTGGAVTPAPAGTYTVLYSAEGGSVATDNVELAAGKSVLCPTPTREGYVFDGWYASKEGAGASFTYVTAGEQMFGDATVLVLYARYSRLVNVTYVLGEGETVNKSLPASAALAPIDKDGYRFCGWYRDAAYTQSATSVAADVTLYARYLPVYRLTYVLDGGALTTAPTVEITAEDVVVLPTPTKANYEFMGWTDAEGTPYSVLQNATADLVLYAQWGRAYYTLQWDFDGVAVTTALPDRYTAGDAFDLPRPVVVGRIFCGWYEGNRLVEQITAADMGDKKFTARWVDSTVTLLANRWSVSGSDGATRTTRWSANISKDEGKNTSAYTYTCPDELRALIAAGKIRATVAATFEVSAQTSGDATLTNTAQFIVNGASVGTVTATAHGGGYSGSYFTDPLRNKTFLLGSKVTQRQTINYALPTLGGSVNFGYIYHLDTDKANTCFDSIYAYRLVTLTITYSLI